MILREQNGSTIYHVGVFGTYDLFSLGGTMFSVVTEKELKKRLAGDLFDKSTVE